MFMQMYANMLSMRTTLNINDKLIRRVKTHTASNSRTITSYVEEALINQLLEDAEDFEDAQKREAEQVLSFDDLVAELQLDGLLTASR
jgi:predicted DNA-binding protein